MLASSGAASSRSGHFMGSTPPFGLSVLHKRSNAHGAQPSPSGRADKSLKAIFGEGLQTGTFPASFPAQRPLPLPKTALRFWPSHKARAGVSCGFVGVCEHQFRSASDGAAKP